MTRSREAIPSSGTAEGNRHGLPFQPRANRPVRLTNSPTIEASRLTSYRAALREGAAVSGVQ